MKIIKWGTGKYRIMQMLSILIVDDELITRKGLKAHIDWEKLQIGTIYDSGSATEALELVRQHKPDLILSDVSMPGMNGIEMCREIRRINRECQIVFLSGYSDKEYLKSAIALEAVDYVEKPIDVEEVEEALSRAVEKQISSKRKKERIRRLVTENHSLTAKRIIERIIVSGADMKALEADLAKIKLDWSDMQEYVTVLVKLCPHEQENVDDKIRDIVQEFQDISYIYSTKEDYHLIFVCAFLEGTAGELVKRLQRYMEKQKTCYCAIGKVVSSKEYIYESYQSAVVKMQQMYFWNKSRFIYNVRIAERSLEFDEGIMERFLQGLKQYKEAVVRDAMEELYTCMNRQQGVMVSSVKGIYFRFIEALFEKAEFSVKNDKVPNADIVGMIWEKLHGIDTLELCQSYLKQETQDYFKNVEELAENNQTMIMVIAYIQAHFHDPELCLENIADNVYLSQNYLSGLFKRKMGKTISQYIVDVRVAQAKVLLRDRSLKLYDVALQIGYKDANYFTKIFKKAVGITPSEFREKYNK